MKYAVTLTKSRVRIFYEICMRCQYHHFLHKKYSYILKTRESSVAIETKYPLEVSVVPIVSLLAHFSSHA